MVQRRRQHFLVVSLGAQGHINPALHLSKRLIRDGAADFTFATSVASHHKILSAAPPSSGPISFIPFTDGHDQGFNPATDDPATYMAQVKVPGSISLSAIVRSAAAEGRPFTCAIYTLLLPWVADVAREFGIPSALFWIQPAAVFSIYYDYFHGYDSLKDDPISAVELPKLPPLRVRDLPSLISPSSAAIHPFILSAFRDIFETLDRELSLSKKVNILVNSFEELEEEQMTAAGSLNLIPVGPLVSAAYEEDGPDTSFGADLLHADAREEYMEWLNSKEEGSVVYVSFGSSSVLSLSVGQREEIARALVESKRPFLWVARGDRDGIAAAVAAAEDGKLVQWCAQMDVLASGAVGCFVTHCGWSSTLESLVCGVPTVGLPQRTDQPTNARLAEIWGFGVTAERGGDGIVEAAELRRCIDEVMTPDGDVRRKAADWSRLAKEAVMKGGSSDRHLTAFVESLDGIHHSQS